jgi:hypothetical protein
MSLVIGVFNLDGIEPGVVGSAGRYPETADH